jgi:inorganic pyrophosphatase
MSLPHVAVKQMPSSGPIWAHRMSEDVTPDLFDVYKMLEPNKQASTIGYGDRDAAIEEIESARRRAKEHP